MELMNICENIHEHESHCDTGIGSEEVETRYLVESVVKNLVDMVEEQSMVTPRTQVGNIEYLTDQDAVRALFGVREEIVGTIDRMGEFEPRICNHCQHPEWSVL